MDLTARQRVLAHVASRPGASASQIAHGLGMAPPAVRHHLGMLRSDGRIVKIGTEGGKARGRPAILYRLSEQLLGDNLDMIAHALLETLAKKWPAARGRVVEALASRLADALGPPPAEKAAPAKLAALVSRLNVLHYQAGWEAGAEGPRVIFGHCPYAAIIEQHPLLCEMDARALSESTQKDARQIAKIDFKVAHLTRCVFLLK